MIVIALGANLDHPIHGPPAATLLAALTALSSVGLTVERRSRFYRTAPVPASSQPWFVNAVAIVASAADPATVLQQLHAVEARFGRVRRAVNEARTLDLDLIDHDGIVRAGPTPPVLPHPRMAERAFVLLPLAELAPDWCHPLTGASVAELIARLPADQLGIPFEPGDAARPG